LKKKAFVYGDERCRWTVYLLDLCGSQVRSLKTTLRRDCVISGGIEMRINRIQQVLSSLLLSSFLAFGQLGAQNGNGNGNANGVGNNPNGNNRNGDKNQPKGRGFSITDSRIMDHGRDRIDIMHGKGRLAFPNKGKQIKLDWNQDVGGPVNSGPAKWNYLYGSETTGDNTNDRVYVGVNAVAGQTASDGFSSSTLNSDWTFGDTKANSSYSLTANPGHLQINVPAGSSHDCWPASIGPFDCANMLRKAANVDATYETKIDGVNLGTAASFNEQTYGMMVWQDNQNYMTFVYWSDGTGVIKVAAVSVFANSGTLVASTTTTLAASNYLRVIRTGLTYTLYYSQNGSSWTTVAPSITAPGGFVVNKVGVHVSNNGNNPANTGNFDYFNVTETTRKKILTFHSTAEPSELSASTLRALEAITDQAQVSITGTVNAGQTVKVSTNDWISSRGNPGVPAGSATRTVPAGSVWRFDFSAKASANSSGVKLFFKVYQVNDSGGGATLVLTSAQQSVQLGNSQTSYNVTGTFASAVTLNPTDRLKFEVWGQNTSGTNRTVTFYMEGTNNSSCTTDIPANNVYAFRDVYNTVGSPNQQALCLWQAAIGNGRGAVNGSSVAFNWDGTRLFLGCTDGKVYCLDSTNGTVIWTYDTGSSIVYSTPFFDANYGSLSFLTTDDLVWIGSTDGRLHKINANTGVGQKTISPVSGFGAYAIHSTPIHYNFNGADVVLVGADDGFVWRVNPNSIDSLVADTSGNLDYDLRNTSTTTAADAIWGTPIFDVGTDQMLLAVNGNFFRVNVINGTKTKDNLFVAGSIMYSSPMIDFANNFAYVGGGAKLWKTDYVGWVSTFSGATLGTNPDNTYPRSSPLWIQDASGTSDFMYIGDGGGYINRFDATGFTSPSRLGTFQFQSLATVATDNDSDSPVIMDFFTGNIYFGSNSYRVYQLTQVF
jgi:hypothetical protein